MEKGSGSGDGGGGEREGKQKENLLGQDLLIKYSNSLSTLNITNLYLRGDTFPVVYLGSFLIKYMDLLWGAYCFVKIVIFIKTVSSFKYII